MAPHVVGDGQQGDRQQQPGKPHETNAAFMIVDEGGTVVRVTGWEKTFGIPAPERIGAPEKEHDRLLACLTEAIDEAGTTGGLARRTAHLDDPPQKVDIAAASLLAGGRRWGSQHRDHRAAAGRGRRRQPRRRGQSDPEART
jgi:hypothetical protein